MTKSVFGWFLWCCLWLPLAGVAGGNMILPDERWLLVDTGARTLSVLRGQRVEARFDEISYGRRGPKPVHYLGDTSTPTGEFRIDAINHKSKYNLFFRLNYPTVAHADLALAAGRISPADHERIAWAEWQGLPPPQDTPLGGMIGIHGVGRGSLKVHQDYNWTEGCVALTNRQIRALEPWVRIGMRVVIREGETGQPAPLP